MKDLVCRLFSSLDQFKKFFSLFSQVQKDSEGGRYVEICRSPDETDSYSLLFRIDTEKNYFIELFMTGYSATVDESADKNKWEFALLKATESSDLMRVQQGYVVVWKNGNWVHRGWWVDYITGFFQWLIDEEHLLARLSAELDTTKPSRRRARFSENDLVLVLVIPSIAVKCPSFFQDRDNVLGLIKRVEVKTRSYIVEFTNHLWIRVHEDYLREHRQDA